MDVITSLKELGDKLTSRKDRRAATHRLQFHRCQGYAILVGVMVRWYASPHIQTLCCLVLHNASFHGEHLLQLGKDIGVMVRYR